MVLSATSQVLEPVWLVVPAFNECERVGRVLTDLHRAGVRNIVLVDDGSTDRTSEIATEHDVWVLRHIVNRGQGAALQTGIDFAFNRGAETIVTFDADGQHQAADLHHLVEPIMERHYDLVLGSRFLGKAQGIPWMRKIVLKLGVWGTRLTTGLRLTDTHNGLRAMTREAAKSLRISEDGMAHASELLSRLAVSNLTWCEVPVTIRYSEHTLRKGQANSAAFRIAFRMLIARVVG